MTGHLDIGMPQHLSNTLYRDTIGQGKSGKSMAHDVESDRLCKEKRTGEDKT